MRISDVSKYFGVHPSTIRRWTDNKLLDCNRISPSSHRYFSCIKDDITQNGIIYIPNIIKGKYGKELSNLHTKFPQYLVIYQEFEVIDKLIKNTSINTIIIFDPRPGIKEHYLPILLTCERLVFW